MKVTALVEVLSNFNENTDVEGQIVIGGFLLDLEQERKRGPKPGCKRTKPYTGAKRGPKPKNDKKANKKDTKKDVKKEVNKSKKAIKKEASSTSEKTE